MKKYIVLLRAVMPSGKNKVPMALLRDVLSKAGFENVRTYIASGNVIVESKFPPEEIENIIHDLILKKIGPDLVVIVRTGSALQQILDDNPFKYRYDISRVFFVLFKSTPNSTGINELTRLDFGEEELNITKKAGYMYIPGSAARSKLSNVFLEKKLKISATTRNYNTMRKLIELSK